MGIFVVSRLRKKVDSIAIIDPAAARLRTRCLSRVRAFNSTGERFLASWTRSVKTGLRATTRTTFPEDIGMHQEHHVWYGRVHDAERPHQMSGSAPEDRLSRERLLVDPGCARQYRRPSRGAHTLNLRCVGIRWCTRHCGQGLWHQAAHHGRTCVGGRGRPEGRLHASE